MYAVVRYLPDWDIPHGCVKSFVPILSTNVIKFEERVKRSVNLVVISMSKVYLNIMTYEINMKAL